MKNETISIIVPVYNIAPYLPRCLDSILAQTYPDLEILAVDDGSTDESGTILDAYAAKDSRIRVIHQENSGVTKARFAGLRAAAGEWIGFVDGDDFIEPDMFERLLRNACQYDADISHCGYQMVFPNRTDCYHNTGLLLRQDTLSGLKDLLHGSRVEPGLCNKLYHRRVFQGLLRSGVEDLGIRINEDLLMNFYLFREARQAVYEDFCPYHYIVRKGSAANTRSRACHVTDPIQVGRILCRETGDQPELYPLALRLYVRRLISGCLQTYHPELASQARRELRQVDRAPLPRRERYMALLVAWATPVYRGIRWVYEKITRVDHKYDLE